VAADEEDGTPSVAITGGTDPSGYYVINGTNVELTAAGAAFVQGGGTLPTLSLTATDSDATPLSTTDTATITINAQNDAPTITVTAGAAIDENSAAAGDVVASFVAADEEDGTPTVAITDGTDPSGYYTIVGTDVQLTAAGAAFVQGGGTLPTLSLTATDTGALTAVDTAAITVNAQNDAPTITVTAGAAIDENSAAAGDVVASFVAADEEDGTPTVAITGGTDPSGYYTINGTNVELTAAGAAFVQGGGTLPTLSLTATDTGALTAVDTAVITVNAQNDAPTITVTAGAAIDENSAAAGDVVASFVAADEEDGTPTVEITGGTDPSGYYTIVGTDVQLTAAGAAFVQGGGTLPTLSLTATDTSALTAVDTAMIATNAQNDAPTITVTAGAAIDENSAAAGDVVASFSAADEEDGTPSVAITGGTDPSGYYVINGTNVELTAAGAAFVQGGGTLPTLSLTATDSGALTAVDTATITVKSSGRSPKAVSSASRVRSPLPTPMRPIHRRQPGRSSRSPPRWR
jgi:hypothetical protein